MAGLRLRTQYKKYTYGYVGLMVSALILRAQFTSLPPKSLQKNKINTLWRLKQTWENQTLNEHLTTSNQTKPASSSNKFKNTMKFIHYFQWILKGAMNMKTTSINPF